MGITQQLEQCHSLGMNTDQNSHHSQQMINQMGMMPSDSSHPPSSLTNPFQTTRCKPHSPRATLERFTSIFQGPTPMLAMSLAGRIILLYLLP